MEFLLFAAAFVSQPDSKSRVEIGHLPQIARDRFVLEFDLVEDTRVGRESGLGPGELGRPALFDLGFRSPPFVALIVNFTVLANFDLELLAERVHDRSAYAVKSTR